MENRADPWLGFWLGAVLAALAILALGGHSASRFWDVDDAVRLEQIREFRAGQSWRDVTIRRMSPPRGVAMHWSRLPDVPVIAIERAAEMLGTGGAAAESAALAVWPAALLPAALALVFLLASQLAPATRPEVVAAAVLAGSFGFLFVPGRIDHHAIQCVLALAAVAGLSGRRPVLHPFAGGVAAGLSLAVGLEHLAVFAAAGTAAFGAAARSAEHRTRPAAFALGVALSAWAGFAAFSPAEASGCDMLGPMWLLPLGVASLALAPALRPISLRMFLACGAASAALAAGLSVASGLSKCAAGPFVALPDDLRVVWLDGISEFAPVWKLSLRDAVEASWPVLLSCLALILLGRRVAKQPRLWAAAAALLVASLTGILHLRGMALAVPLAAPWIAAGAAKIPWTARRTWLAAALACPLIAGGVADLAGPATTRASAGPCGDRPSMAGLAGLPHGIVAAPLGLGVAILLDTPHAILGASYHRNVEGLRSWRNVFLGSEEQAREDLFAREADYVAWCPGADENGYLLATAPDGFFAGLLAGRYPSWLQRLPSGAGSPAVARVVRPSGSPEPRQ